MIIFSKVMKRRRLLYSFSVFCFFALVLFFGVLKTPKGLADNASQPNPLLASVTVPADVGTLGPIPDNDPTGRNVTFSVSGLPQGQLVQSVSIEITMDHAWSGDLTATLISPGATNMHTVFDESGENSSNLNGTYTFNDTSMGNLCDAAMTAGNNDIIPAGGYRTRNNACNITEMNPSFTGLVVPFANQDDHFEKGKKGKSKRLPDNLANGTWTLRVVDDQATDTGNITGAQLTIVTVVPTAASATISGRVKTSNGRGLKFVTVGLTGGNISEPIYATTNQFGNFVFEDIEVGETYVLTVSSKRYKFNNSTQVFTLYENLSGMDFIGNER